MSLELQYISVRNTEKGTQYKKIVEKVNFSLKIDPNNRIKIIDPRSGAPKKLIPIFIVVPTAATEFQEAVQKGNADEAIVKMLSKEFKALDAGSRTEVLRWAFKKAIVGNCHKIISAIIEYPNYKKAIQPDLGWALTVVARTGNLEIVRMITQNTLSQDPLHWKTSYATAYRYAAQNGHADVVLELMQNASEDIGMFEIRDIFEYANENGHSHVEKAMKEKYSSLGPQIIFKAVDAQIAIKDFFRWCWEPASNEKSGANLHPVNRLNLINAGNAKPKLF